MELEDTLLCTRRQLDALPALTEPLMVWYRGNARVLPWRAEPTPYRVWISEIMLQQTRVEAVRGYYERFLAVLPSVEALAAAPEDTLLKLWEGLGYYSRARNLQKAARLIMERHSGFLPASYGELLALPGIGEYTAGAIASIAFGIPEPAVDGNVYRVLSRFLASYADTSQSVVKKAFREAAATLLPDKRPGDLNQALIELGAIVCVPNAAPRCESCAIYTGCAARVAGCAGELPVKARKKARRLEARTVVLLVSAVGVLLFRRENRGLLPGLYQPLNLEGHLDLDAVGAAVRNLGGEPRTLLPLASAKHIFSHVEWHMQGYLAIVERFDTPGAVWADAGSLEGERAVPSAFRAFFRDIGRYFLMARG